MSQKLLCSSCAHFITCLIPKGISQMIAQHFKPETMPLIPDQLATICQLYLNATALKISLDLSQEEPQQ